MNGRDGHYAPIGGFEFESEEEEIDYANWLIAQAINFEAIPLHVTKKENNNGTYSRTDDNIRIQDHSIRLPHGTLCESDRLGDATQRVLW